MKHFWIERIEESYFAEQNNVVVQPIRITKEEIEPLIRISRAQINLSQNRFNAMFKGRIFEAVKANCRDLEDIPFNSNILYQCLENYEPERIYEAGSLEDIRLELTSIVSEKIQQLTDCYIDKYRGETNKM